MMQPKTQTAQLLETYLPPKNGRTPADRLFAIAGKALADGSPRIEHRLHTTLTPDERYDAHSHLTLVGLKCVTAYDPAKDNGTGTIPQDVRFGRFAYLRMRLALIDWERKQYGDRRPGRTRHPDFVDLSDHHDDDPDPIDLETLAANRDQAARWRAQAARQNLTIAQWITTTLDAACTGDRREAA